MSACDLLVAGAGPAGAAAAVTAARRGLDVILVHDPRPGLVWAGESLPPGMADLAAAVFAPAVIEGHLPAYGTRAAWGGEALVATDFLANPQGGGLLLDRARFDAAARTAAVAAGARLVEGRAGAISGAAGAWRLALADGRAIAARFVIDAAGRAAPVARQLGAGRAARDRQVAVVAAFADAGDPFQGTSVEAVEDGWWYTTPLPGRRRVLAFLTDADLWQARAGNWTARLAQTRHMARCAGPAAAAARPRACPAETASARTLHGPGWLAAGDAAMTFDPLSSQGIAAAVLMGSRAGAAAAGALGAGTAPALAEWVEDYRTLEAETADLRTFYARLERRWPDAPFWARRAAQRME
ncbi:tryptophan 7-halogenase [Xanthobacter sp. KR7-225]|uniref:tryptophan 7-halogenase n=1 Tax=Xanthobacter sp. KR7-225 TaxID=3156613 RepID=UPI0032B4000F